MTKALATQIGGNHYKGFKIEPFTFALVNHYDPAVFSVLKYVSRHTSKNGLEDLGKAKHILYIRADEAPQDVRIGARNKIDIETYISENKIPDAEAGILRDLHLWARNELSILTDHQAADWIATQIDQLAKDTYGKEPQ